MATYSLTDIEFREEDGKIIASAQILKDAALLQSFSMTHPITTNHLTLARAVAKHAQSIVIHDRLTAEVFTSAEQWLLARTWDYE